MSKAEFVVGSLGGVVLLLMIVWIVVALYLALFGRPALQAKVDVLLSGEAAGRDEEPASAPPTAAPNAPSPADAPSPTSASAPAA